MQPAAQHFRMPAHDHQQIVEVVRDAAGELADGFHLLHLRELFARALKRALGLTLFGDVLAHPEQPRRPSGIVLDDLDTSLQVSYFAAWANNSALRAKSLSRLAGVDRLLLCACTILRMHQCEKVFGRAARIPWS